MVDDTLILPWLERVRQELPELSLFDAHTHLGDNDPDGYSCSRGELVEGLERADARAVVFPMHEPEGYPPANDMVIADAAARAGVNLFRRFDLMRHWNKDRNIPIDQMIESDGLHQTDWCTGCVVRALDALIADAVARAYPVIPDR